MLNWEVFCGRETELNWNKRDELLNYLIRDIEQRGRTTHLIAPVRASLHDLLALLHSARTQLALSAAKFFARLAAHSSREEVELLSDPLVSNILRVCGTTKRILASAGEECLCHLFVKMAVAKTSAITLMVLGEKNAGLRQRVVESLLFAVRGAPDRWFLDNRQGPGGMEEIIKKALSDAAPQVRDAAAELFLLLREMSPSVSEGIQEGLDTITAKQLRQILTKKSSEAKLGVAPCQPSSPEAMPERGPLLCTVPEETETKAILERSLAVDQEVAIPMQSITLSDDDTIEADIRGESPLKISSCRIPLRSPRSATRPPPQLALSTPYRRYRNVLVEVEVEKEKEEEEDGPSHLSPPKFSIASLVDMVCDAAAPVPGAVWKKLLLLVRSTPSTSLDEKAVAAILAAVHQRLSQLTVFPPEPRTAYEPDDDICTVGVLTRHLLRRPIDASRSAVEAIVHFSSRFHENEHIWEDPPHTWLPWTAEHVNALLGLIASATDDPRYLECGTKVAAATTEFCDMRVLDVVHDLWSSVASSANVKRAVVPFLTVLRRRIGDAAFFQALPLLSPPQRRLLDAYMSLEA